MSEAVTGGERHPRRTTAVLGVFGAVLVHTGASLLGDTPDTRDASSDIAEYFRSNRNAVMTGSTVMTGGFLVVVGMGWIIASRLDADGARSAAAVLRAAATAAGSVYLVTLPLPYLTLSYVVAAEAPEQAKALFEATIVATNILAWPLAITFAAGGIGLRRLRSGTSYLSMLLAALVAVSAVSVARSGYFSPDVQQQVLVLSTVVWLGVVGFAR